MTDGSDQFVMKIRIHKVGLLIGKRGETIKSMQAKSGARIQLVPVFPGDQTPERTLHIYGTSDQIEYAKRLINETIREAEAGGSSSRMVGQPGSAQLVMKIPIHKVGLVIGRGGVTIKSIQAKTGARLQVIPLTPGVSTLEQTLQIDGTSDQIEHAKNLVNETIREITKEDLVRAVALLDTILKSS